MAKNFKSNKAYKSWLAYGHASGKFAETPGHQSVSIKGKRKKVKHEHGGPHDPLYTKLPEVEINSGPTYVSSLNDPRYQKYLQHKALYDELNTNRLTGIAKSNKLSLASIKRSIKNIEDLKETQTLDEDQLNTLKNLRQEAKEIESGNFDGTFRNLSYGQDAGYSFDVRGKAKEYLDRINELGLESNWLARGSDSEYYLPTIAAPTQEYVYDETEAAALRAEEAFAKKQALEQQLQQEQKLNVSYPEGSQLIQEDFDPAFGTYGNYMLTPTGEHIPVGKTKEDYEAWKQSQNPKNSGVEERRLTPMTFQYGGPYGNPQGIIKQNPRKVTASYGYGGPKYPSGPYYPYKGSTLRVNKGYDKNHVQPSVFNHGGPGPHIDPTALEQANANINTANTDASNYFSNPDNFASTQKMLNEYANVGNYKPITYSGGFTNTGNTVFGGYNSPVNQSNTLTGGEFYNNNEGITDLPIISYNDFTDEKGQHFYVPNYGIKTPTPPIDRDLATEIAQRPVMQNVPLQTNKMKSKVKGANNKYMKNVGTKHFQTQALDEQGNPIMEDYSVFKQGDKTINERTYNTALRKQQEEQAAYETELLKAKEQINKFKTYGGPMKKNYKNGGDKKKYIPTEKQQILIDKGLLSYKDALGGEGPKTNTAWENYVNSQGGTNIRQIQDSLIKQGLLTEEALKSDKGLWGDASEAAYQKFLNNTDISGNDILTTYLPLNIASVVDDLGGNALGTEKTDVFTANNLKQSERDFMLNAARENLAEGKPYMEYADYKTHLNPDGTIKESALKKKTGSEQYFDVGSDKRTIAEKAIAEFDPAYNLKTHFGQSVLGVAPAFGDRMYNDTLVLDQYNFNNKGPLSEKDIKYLEDNPYDLYMRTRLAAKKRGSGEGEGRYSMAVLNEDNNKKESIVSNAAKQIIGGPGISLLKKGYDYFTKANGGNLYPYGGPTEDIKKLMIAEGINPEHYNKYKDTIDNIYTEIKKPGKYSPGFMDNLKIKAASKYYPNVNEIINKFDAGTFNMGGYMKYANGAELETDPPFTKEQFKTAMGSADMSLGVKPFNRSEQYQFYTGKPYKGDRTPFDRGMTALATTGIGAAIGATKKALDYKNKYEPRYRQEYDDYMAKTTAQWPDYEMSFDEYLDFHESSDRGYKKDKATQIGAAALAKSIPGFLSNFLVNRGLDAIRVKKNKKHREALEAAKELGEATDEEIIEFRNQQKHGGYMQYVNGGQFDTGGQMGEFSSVPVTEFNNGGSHEANALGGIPQGPSALVEEGELKLDLPSGEQFIVSPKIMYKKNDKEVEAIAQELGISEKEFKRFAGKDMVSVFKSLTRKNSFNAEKREGDTIQENSIEADIMPFVELHTFLTERKNAQEEAKKEQAFAQDMDMMMQEHPEYMQAMMAQQQQQGPSPEEQAMMEQQMMQQQGGAPQGMPPMMGTYGGMLEYKNGGLWANIHAKRARGEKMRKPGSKGAPTAQALKDSQTYGGKMNPDGSVVHFNNGGYSYSDYLAPQQAMPVQGVAASGYAQGGMMPKQYKYGAGMKVAGNVLDTAAPFLSAIPGIGPILTPIAAGAGEALKEAGAQKAAGEETNWQDIGAKAAIGAGSSFIPGAGGLVESAANTVYDKTLDSSKKSQAEIQEILNNPDHPEYEKTVKMIEESKESNKAADITNQVIGTAGQIAGGIASNQANTAASNVEGMDAFAAAGGAPEGTTTGYSGGKFSGANDMSNYSSYAPGFTAGPDGTAVPIGNAYGGYMKYMHGGVMNTPVNYNYGGRRQYNTGGLVPTDPPKDLAATGVNKDNFFQKLKFRNVSGKTVAKDSFIALEALSDYGFNPKDDTVLTSLTRTEELNKKVGGVSNSLHLTGRAMDVSSQGDSKEFLDWTKSEKGKKWLKDFNIDKVDETSKKGAPHWHFEFNDIKDTSKIKNYDTYATTFEDNKDANTGMINLDTYSSNPQVTEALQQGTVTPTQVNNTVEERYDVMGRPMTSTDNPGADYAMQYGASATPEELEEYKKKYGYNTTSTPANSTSSSKDPVLYPNDPEHFMNSYENYKKFAKDQGLDNPSYDDFKEERTLHMNQYMTPAQRQAILDPTMPADIDTDQLEEAELDAQTEAEMFADAPEVLAPGMPEDEFDYTQNLEDANRKNQYLKPTLLENMIGAAPGIANIAMGLGKDDKLKLDRIDPISAKYISLDESRKANERLLAAQQDATKNVAGNAGGGNYLANMQATYLKYLQGMSGIDQQEQNANAQIANQTAARNAQIAAQNAQLGFREQDYDARTKAAKQNMIGTGIGQIADVYQGNQQNKFLTNTYLPTISPDYAQFYKWQKDPNKNWLGLNKKNKG